MRDPGERLEGVSRSGRRLCIDFVLSNDSPPFQIPALPAPSSSDQDKMNLSAEDPADQSDSLLDQVMKDVAAAEHELVAGSSVQTFSNVRTLTC